MTPKLSRITTLYVDRDDRIRLAGEIADGAPVVIWLTQRLLYRLLPLLLKPLEPTAKTASGPASAHSEILHSFAQQAARAELVTQSAVRATPASAEWLALAVTVTASAQFLRVTFRGEIGEADLELPAKPLRQWLGILHSATCKAGWPQDAWPDWIRENTTPVKQSGVVLH